MRLRVARSANSPPDEMDAFYVHDQRWDMEDAGPFAPLIITGYLYGENKVLGQIDLDDALAELPGERTRLLPSPIVIDLSHE